jgi:hypothetical protein
MCFRKLVFVYMCFRSTKMYWFCLCFYDFSIRFWYFSIVWYFFILLQLDKLNKNLFFTCFVCLFVFIFFCFMVKLMIAITMQLIHHRASHPGSQVDILPYHSTYIQIAYTLYTLIKLFFIMHKFLYQARKVSLRVYVF